MGSIGFAGLLLALMLVQARAGYLPYSQSAPPSQTALANDFCSIGGDDLLPSQNFCTTAGLNKDEPPTDKTCKLLDIAERLAASVVVPTGPAACTAMLQTSVVGPAAPVPLIDARPLPGTFVDLQFIGAEGPSAYWHWKHLNNFQLWAPCATSKASTTSTKGYVKNNNKALEWMRPASWTVLSTLWVPTSLYSNTSSPIATILTNSKTKQMTILIRGTQTLADLLTDLRYNLNSTGSLKFPGKTHQGFTELTNALWRNGVREALYSNVVKGSITSVSIAGHSMGGSVATLLAYAAQGYLLSQPKTKTFKNVKVDAYLFAAANVGNADFVEDFNDLVNARRYSFAFDLIPQLPCTPRMAACPNMLVPTPPSPTGFWEYASVGGLITMGPQMMPQQPTQWNFLVAITPCQAVRFVAATHSCSYSCFLSQFAGDLNNSCLLWDKNTPYGQGVVGGAGTYCAAGLGLFPVTDGAQYPEYINFAD
uniref:Fungal lipase-type domain-containing protein n=1 Tax=Tetradesmus obliquus TaxID=3088 RepID=A0A383WB42_TETOB|eukprot:jgi/Sobl393_1/2823/SZX73906.1